MAKNTNFFTPDEMMVEAEHYASKKTKKSTSQTIGLAIMAGLFIGLAFVFYITVTAGEPGTGLVKFAGGLAFSLGLIFVVLCGSELFTSSVLSILAWANKEISIAKMVITWGKVYLGNFLGAMLLLMLVTGASLYTGGHGSWGLNALNIAQHKLHHTFLEAFCLGILCNLLVCLAVWLTFSSQNAFTKAFMTMLPVALFVSSGFEHCVANMFMIPLGITIHAFAPEHFWHMIGVDASHYADLTVANFIVKNLIPVTLGNIVGGALLVGLGNWCVFSLPRKNSSDK